MAYVWLNISILPFTEKKKHTTRWYIAFVPSNLYSILMLQYFNKL